MNPLGNTAHDARLHEGFRQQRTHVAVAESEGAVQSGWKAGFGAPLWQERLALHAPLVGTLLDRTRRDPGCTIAIGTWQDARAEAELAVLLGEDVPPEASPQQARAAVAAVAPAIELVDLSTPPTSPSEALATNLYHRFWLTGTFTELAPGAALSDLAAHVRAMDVDSGPLDDLEALTGRAGDTLAEIARLGAQHGRGLERDDIVLLGSIIPPVAVQPGGSMRYTLGNAQPIEVLFTA